MFQKQTEPKHFELKDLTLSPDMKKNLSYTDSLQWKNWVRVRNKIKKIKSKIETSNLNVLFSALS